MGKPDEAEKLETYIKVLHKLGRSNEAIAAKLSGFAHWFMESQLDDEIDTRVEQTVAAKVMEVTDRAMVRYVGRVLGESET